MFRWLAKNLRIFLLAFALAVTVWVSAVTSADPDESRLFPSAIPIEYIGQDPGLILTGPVVQSVQLTLRAPSSVWDQLLADRSQVRVLADLTGLDAGEHNVALQVQVGLRPVRVMETVPARLNLVLEPLATRSLTIALTLEGEPAIGYQIGDLALNPAQAVVSGPESEVARVARLHASLDLRGARQDIVSTVAIQAIDAEGEPVTGVTVQPEEVQVNLPVTQIGGYRDLVVKVVVRGQPASGYRPTSISPFPLVVTVYSSNLELISSLPGYVETLPLDLTGRSEGFEARLDLVLPTGITLVGDQTVLVQVGIESIEGGLTVSYRPVELVGLGNGLRAQVQPVTVDVLLSGPLPALDSLLTTDILVRVDLSGLGPGTYQLTPQVEILVPDIDVESVLPGTVEVVISIPVTPTP